MQGHSLRGNAFSVPHVLELVIFQNNARIQNLESSPDECMQTEITKFAMQRLESPLIFGTLNRSFLLDQRQCHSHPKRVKFSIFRPIFVPELFWLRYSLFVIF